MKKNKLESFGVVPVRADIKEGRSFIKALGERKIPKGDFKVEEQWKN